MKKKSIYISIIVILLLLLIGAAWYFLHNQSVDKPSLPTDSNAVEYEGDKPTNRLPNGQKGIAIPGFDTLVFSANQTNQRVNFFNPDSNDCLFLMTLYIDDKPLWKSGYCKPGTGYYDIELSEPLKAGEYSAYLKMQCFKEDGTVLNGAKVEFDITVQEV